MENSQSIDLILDPANQSEITDKNERSRMSKLCKNGKYLCENEDGEVKTLYDAFKTGARVSNNGKAYGWKPSPSEPFQWISYNDVLVRAANVGAGLIAKGLKPENTTNVGIYSQNRVEYGITEQACYMYSMVLVPLYDTLGPEACTHIINQAEIKTVVCDKNVKVKAILSRIKETPDLESIILVEEPSEEMKELAQKHNIDLTSFAELEALGEKNPQEPKPAKPDDLCVLCYTSGTTGLPKGAMLTHRGTMATVVAAGAVLKPGGIDISPEDTLISYLPLAHSYERLLECYCVLNGARIGFFQGDVKLLLDDIKELQPTLFPSVPRLLNRIYDKKEDKKKKKTDEAILNADTSEVKMIFGKQKVHIRNRRSCHGTKLLKSSLCLALIFWPSAGGTGHGSGQPEHQGHSDIYPSTLNVVSNCPSLGEYMQRSLAKCADVCGSYLQDGNCVYHCMRDSSKTKLVEFCAKPKPLFDFCPEYDPVDQTIQKDTATLCNSTFSQNYYNSSDIYFCDPNNCLQLRESSVRSGATTLTTLMNETTEMNDGDSQELFVWLFVGLAALTLAIIIGYIFHCVFVRLGIFSEQSRKMTEKGNQNGQQHVYTEEMITLV